MLRAVSTNPLFATTKTLGRPQVVTTRCACPNATRQGTASGRTDVRIEGRIKLFGPSVAVNDLQVAIAGWYLKNDATGQHVLGNDFNYEAAIELPSPSMYQPLRFAGQRIPTVDSTTYGTPYRLSDPGWNLGIGADSYIYLREARSIATASLLLPHTAQGSASSVDSAYASAAITSQIPGTGAITDPGSGLAFSPMWPFMILGKPVSPIPSVGWFGDSIATGTGDTIDTNTGVVGFIMRGLQSVNGHAISGVACAVGGHLFSKSTVDISPYIYDILPHITHFVIQIGSNDIAAGTNLSALQTYVNNILTIAKGSLGPYLKPVKTAAVTIFPRTTSSDSWATAANQTAVSGFGIGSVRDTYNAWIKSIVGAGLLDAVIDVNPYVEDQSNLSKWITNNSANYPTTDGIHPTLALHTLAATAVNNWAAGITP